LCEICPIRKELLLVGVAKVGVATAWLTHFPLRSRVQLACKMWVGIFGWKTKTAITCNWQIDKLLERF
jgi:hypothetical protein